MKKAIVVGASSGIGKSLSELLVSKGYRVGICARRMELLQELQAKLGNDVLIQQVDVRDTSSCFENINTLISEMGGVDLLIISAGVGYPNPELNWEAEEATVDVNVRGFMALANLAFKTFATQKSGHLVNISSIAAIRGNAAAPAYGASKSFESSYIKSLQHKISKERLPITITDIQPGFVDTDMAKGPGLFWVATPEKAAEQIYQAIVAKRSHAYITRRWWLIAWFLKLVPDFVYNRL